MIYEGLLLVGVLSLAFLLPHVALGVVYQVSARGPVLAAHVFLVLGIYFVWLWRRNGQTLAMQTWRIKLVTLRGPGRLPFGQALLRYVVACAGIVFYGAGLFWAFFDRDRQFLHDRLAGTRLVQLPRHR